MLESQARMLLSKSCYSDPGIQELSGSVNFEEYKQESKLNSENSERQKEKINVELMKKIVTEKMIHYYPSGNKTRKKI